MKKASVRQFKRYDCEHAWEIPWEEGKTMGKKIVDYEDLMMTPAGVDLDKDFFKNVKAVHAHNKTMAEDIDPRGKIVQAVNVDTGERLEFPYDQLVIATGSMPVRPSLPGIDLPGVYVLSNLEEAIAIRKEMEAGRRRGVIIGAGLCGGGRGGGCGRRDGYRPRRHPGRPCPDRGRGQAERDAGRGGGACHRTPGRDRRRRAPADLGPGHLRRRGLRGKPSTPPRWAGPAPGGV